MKLKYLNFSFLLLVFSVMIGSCSNEPKPIIFGTDNCDYCKMTISDQRYGAEVVTTKGRIYKFDDLHCIKGFLVDEFVEPENVYSLWLIDFSMPETLIKAEESFLLLNDQLQSPMGSNIAAFAVEDSLKKYYSTYSGTEMKWEDFLIGSD